MKKFDYTITDTEGIHSRPAGLFVKESGKFSSKITIAKDGKEVDAKRIFGIMSLGVKKDNTVTLKIEGDDEEEAFTALEAFFKENL